MVKEKILINAQLELVLEAIRHLRGDHGRKLESYDGKIAIINEELDGVPIHGKVHCVWQEIEESTHRIEFKLLSSTKFKESYGSYILTASSGDRTTLEIHVHMDAGIMVPFAAELTKASTSKDTKIRLEKIKKLAEGLKQEKQTANNG